MKTIRRRSGSIAVEFSLTLPLLVMTAVAVIQLSFFLQERQRFIQATFEAARYASSGPDLPTNSQVADHAVFVLQTMGMDPAGLQLAIVRGVDQGDQVVTVDMQLPVRTLGSTVSLPAVHEQQFTLVDRGI